ATPYVLVVVKLREGVLMTGHLRNIPGDQVRIGQPVRVAFESVNDNIALPVFEPDVGGA
ncbi:MAG: Zn-ribbon domain-containing OB-fold protein, partial [Burkholderiales bacterium]